MYQSIETSGPNVPKVRGFWRVFTATAIAIFMVISPVVSAEAANWFVYYDDPYGAPTGVWKSVSTGATYNLARTRTYNSDSAVAWVNVAGVGTSSAGHEVTLSFSYRRVTAKCKWDSPYGYGTGPLRCDLRY